MTADLFPGTGFRARAIREDDIARLQRFLEANPEYFLVVGGAPPRANEALLEFHDRPPRGWPWDLKWLVAFDDPGGAMVAVADVVSNLLAPGVWHIGLFIVATRLHGSGAARA